MSHAITDDGVKLYFEETGEGVPLVFVHEFAGDLRSWEPQVRYFSRRFRCVTFNARGYPPSDVPEDPSAYSQTRAANDIRDVMAHLGLERAHLVGLSMGGFAVLEFGMTYPDRALSLVVAGAGYGAEKEREAEFRKMARDGADQMEAHGMEAFAGVYGMGASRIPYLVKDPRGWEEFRRLFAEHSVKGSANTIRGIQAQRPSLYDLEDRLRAMTVPTLIVTGDEDDPCLMPDIFLKRTIPASGLVVLPKTGHAVNLEEPDLFNRLVGDFLSLAEAGRWLPRDPRSSPDEIIKTR